LVSSQESSTPQPVDRAAPTVLGVVEAPLTLSFTPPRTMGFWDQLVLWLNLGVSLTGPVTALYVISPYGPNGTPMSLLAALVATVVGAVLGSAMLGLSGVPSSVTGAPAMVVLRGLFGRRGSIVPTVLNIVQNIGWGTIEVLVISSAATALTSPAWRPFWVLFAGAGATAMAVFPLGSVRALRKVIIWAVLFASAYLFVQLLRQPLPPLTQGGWNGFGYAFDTVIAVCVSYSALIGDYSRHSRRSKDTVYGAWIGYSAAAIAYITLGLLAYSTTVRLDGDVIGGLLAVPAGAIALLILTVDEVDEAFANVYSTTMSIQNLWGRIDRRWIAIGIGGLSTLLALSVDLNAYQTFLYVIGSVFVPLAAVVIVDWFFVSHGEWDLSERSRVRWSMVVAWFIGLAGYQLVNPGGVKYWSDFWSWLARTIGFAAPTWLAASWSSFVLGGLATLVLGTLFRRRAAAGPGSATTPAPPGAHAADRG
jgi:NCS1 family nucleobase:cation symporter-1